WPARTLACSVAYGPPSAIEQRCTSESCADVTAILISRGIGAAIRCKFGEPLAPIICPQVKSAPGPVRSNQQCNTTDGSIVLGDSAGGRYRLQHPCAQRSALARLSSSGRAPTARCRSCLHRV